MFTMKTARPSQENRDIIKQMVIDWYRKSSPKRDFDLQNLLTETDGKLGSVMFPPNGFLNTPSKDPFSWVEWGRQPGSLSFVQPIYNLNELKRPQPLQVGQFYRPNNPGERFLMNVLPKHGYHGHNPHHNPRHRYGSSVHHEHHGFHKHVVHLVAVPVPVHHEHHEKKHDITTWIWPLVLLALLPIILGGLLLPQALMLLTNFFMFILSMGGNIQGGGSLVPVFPGGSSSTTNPTGRRRRRKSILGSFNHTERLAEQIYRKLMKAFEMFE